MTGAAPLDVEENPSWVLELPDAGDLPPPVETHEQELPFGKITWQNFERLCLRLAGADGDVEYSRLYGNAGQEQGGIDIYVRRRSTTKYATWQSKRRKSFVPSEIETAVTDFLDGDWAAKSDKLVLCVQASLRSTAIGKKIEECATKLRERGIEFLPLDGEQLSERLKSSPQIVYDFFGPVWVERFCGKEAARSVEKRLSPAEFRFLKGRLLACYTAHFTSVDPGVLSLAATKTGARRQLPLSERFVPPDLSESKDIDEGEPAAEPAPTFPEYDPETGLEYSAVPTGRIEKWVRQERTRVTLENWIADGKYEIVLGLAGSGKSTLLRFIALDTLSACPKLVGWRKRMPDYLPVWVSFAFWTKLIAADKDKCSLIDAIEAWFHRQDEPGLVALVGKAYDDKRLLLLVDGIDEWENETAANTAFGLLQSFIERHANPVIVTSRPHGYRLVTGLDGSWRFSRIAPFKPEQQVALAQTWFAHLNSSGEDRQRDEARSLAQATAFVAELRRNGPMAELATIPLLLTGLIALKSAQLALPRNRFVAYEELTKLLFDLHPAARDKAAFAGGSRPPMDSPTREIALAGLAYAIHSGEEDASPDAIDNERAVAVVSACLEQRVGLVAANATQVARAIVTVGEEDIGILVKKSPREVGFFHRTFQEFLSSKHLASFDFEQQLGVVGVRGADPRWSDVILCLLHQLRRPAEVDRLLEKIESVQGDIATCAVRDTLLAEATFGEIRKSPQTATRLADKAFEQIELSQWPAVRRAIAAHAIDGLASPVLAPKVLDKVQQWFPRWHSYGLADAFSAMGEWPDDPGIRPALWRGLHDEYLGSAQAAAHSIAKRFSGEADMADCLCRLIAAPPNVSAAVAAMEALCRGWPRHPKLPEILDHARASANHLIAVTAIRARIALAVQTSEDFELLTRLAEHDDYSVAGFINQAMIDGWAGDERLRTYALNVTPGEHKRRVPHLRPDFGLLINGFPGDREVAGLVAADFANQHPRCLFEKDDLRALALHFKADSTIVQALEAWVLKHRSDDGCMLSHAARVGPTPTLKAALLRCVENDRLSFWAAPALVDLWGVADAEVRVALLATADWPVEKRQHVAHTLPYVVTDKAECRRLLLEIFAGDERIRVDFALQGIRHLAIDATDRGATDCVLARGYDAERFVVENEAREVIDIFRDDPRVVELAKRQLQREGGVIGTVASVFAGDVEMRRLVLRAALPLELGMRISILEFLHARAGPESAHRGLISAARHETAGEIVVGASIKLGQLNRDTDQISTDYLTETGSELEAIGPRMDARRQGAAGALIAVKRLDLLPAPDGLSGLHGVGMHQHREMLRFVATEWADIVASLGSEDAALAALGVSRDYFFDTFGNDLSASEAIGALALRLIENAPDRVPAAAIRFAERVRPGGGFLRDLCLRGLNYRGAHQLGHLRDRFNSR